MGKDDSKKPATVVFNGKIGQVVHTEQPDGRVFEHFVRPPGTRIVIVSSDKKILITKEHRLETGNVDLRLPGGKVRDTLASYNEFMSPIVALSENAATSSIWGPNLSKITFIEGTSA